MPIKSLGHLQELWDASCKEVLDQSYNANSKNAAEPTFARLELQDDDDLVFEVKSAVQAQKEVMETHAISKPYNIAPPNRKYKHTISLPGISASMVCLMTIIASFIPGSFAASHLLIDNERQVMNDDSSDLSRAMVSMVAKATNPSNPIHQRASFPENNPQICLAFLSCCDRTDLLNHTIAGAIRHLEEEPSYLRYEIAWVDNGSAPDSTDEIRNSYPMEHVLTLPSNKGLAYGMNLLIRNLCQAPYVLLLEEDWLYLDELVAPQTPERKRSIATSIALIEHLKRTNTTAFDGRNVMGVFLRHETYESFLTFPHADIWERLEDVDISKELALSGNRVTSAANISGGTSTIDYRIFCADTGLKSDSVWGSYTNGAGLYHRGDLMAVGRMFGEPGDAFHDRYVEGNYAFRVALKNCHAALRLTQDETCGSISDVQCAGAFHHIGGGRGTRPRKPDGALCEDPGWNFFGTPLYAKYHRYIEAAGSTEICTPEDLVALKDQAFRKKETDEWREQVRKENEEVFRKEAKERQNLLEQARIVLELLETNPTLLRSSVPWMETMSEKEIMKKAHRMERLANSPHPLEGFWDSLGRAVHDEL
jgi:hypothetical protein